jgi:tetratricopeptide (TPR) repeat protein
VSRPRLYLSYDVDYDRIAAFEFGRPDDGHPSDGWRPVSDEFAYLHDPTDGPCVGFLALGFSDLQPEDEGLEGLWEGPRFDVPLLALTDACAGEILLAARPLLGGASTLNRELFDSAVASGGDPEVALSAWLACLQSGDQMAHFGLGYTLYDLGRHHEAYRHLRHYARIAPDGSWVWCWLGKAAAAIGERAEARRAYERAIELAAAGGEDTDAPELLAALNRIDMGEAA